jgi:hypothetical protein
MKHHQPTTGPSSTTRTKRPAPARTKATGAPARDAAVRGDTREALIRETAYSFYVARGCVDGCALEDWLQAEAQCDRAFAQAPSEPASSATTGH